MAQGKLTTRDAYNEEKDNEQGISEQLMFKDSSRPEIGMVNYTRGGYTWQNARLFSKQ